MPRCVAEPLHLPPFDCCQQWFLFASLCFDLLPDVVVGLAVFVIGVQDPSEALHLECLNATFQFGSKCPCLTAVQGYGCDECLVESDLGVGPDVVASPHFRQLRDEVPQADPEHQLQRPQDQRLRLAAD